MFGLPFIIGCYEQYKSSNIPRIGFINKHINKLKQFACNSSSEYIFLNLRSE